jgi:hypothetical protein
MPKKEMLWGQKELHHNTRGTGKEKCKDEKVMAREARGEAPENKRRHEKIKGIQVHMQLCMLPRMPDLPEKP